MEGSHPDMDAVSVVKYCIEIPPFNVERGKGTMVCIILWCNGLCWEKLVLVDDTSWFKSVGGHDAPLIVIS
jgi:hypothetical protein